MDRAMHRRAAWLAWLLSLGSVALAVGATWFLVQDDYTLENALNEAPSIELALAFPVVGAVVAARHPRNPIGWILCFSGITQGIVEFTYLYAKQQSMATSSTPALCPASNWLHGSALGRGCRALGC